MYDYEHINGDHDPDPNMGFIVFLLCLGMAILVGVTSL
mgnify:CR=1 FL=1